MSQRRIPELLWRLAGAVHQLVERSGLEVWKRHVEIWAAQTDADARTGLPLLDLPMELSIDEKYAILAAVHDARAKVEGGTQIDPWPDGHYTTYSVLKMRVVPYPQAGVAGLDEESQAPRLLSILREVAADLEESSRLWTPDHASNVHGSTYRAPVEEFERFLRDIRAVQQESRRTIGSEPSGNLAGDDGTPSPWLLANHPARKDGEIMDTNELRRFIELLKDWSNIETTLPNQPSDLPPILKGDPLHASGEAMQQSYAGRLPGEANSRWLRLLCDSREGDDKEAFLSAEWLIGWAEIELQRVNEKSQPDESERQETGWDPATFDRNAFIYKQAIAGTVWAKIMAEVKKHEDWASLESVQGVKDAAEALAKRTCKPPIPPRQHGKPRSRI